VRVPSLRLYRLNGKLDPQRFPKPCGSPLSEAYGVAEPEEKHYGQNVQGPPVSSKPLELIHG